MVSDAMAAALSGLAARPGFPLPSEAVGQCCTALGVDGAAAALLHKGAPSGEPLWASGDTASALQELEFTLGVGPGIDTVLGGVLVLEPDLRAAPADRWPGFAPGAERLGVRAVFAFPLQMGAIHMGVLLLHRAAPGPLRQGELAEAQVFADALVLTLLGGPASRDGDGHPDGVDWLAERATLSRAEVHQATGMVAVQLGVRPGEALLRLRGYAYAQNLPLLTVAREVVARRVRLTDDQDSEKDSM